MGGSLRRIPDVASLLRDLGDILTVAIAGPADRRVTSAVIYDETDTTAWPIDAVLLGVGVRSRVDIQALLALATVASASLVIVRRAADDEDPLRDVDVPADVTVAVLPGSMPWNQLNVLINNSIGGNARLTPGIPGGDLFGMANVICSLIDAPVTIEDINGAVVAFSHRQEEADFIRQESILGRRTPDPFFAKDIERGAFERIRKSVRPVFLEAIETSDGRTALPRAAVAVRVGDEMLGTIWAVVRSPLSADQEQSLWEASLQVALHLLEVRAQSDVERAYASRLTAVALSGGPDGLAACAQLAITAPSVVVALSTPRTFPDLARHESAQLRVLNLLATHLRMLYPSAVVGSVSRSVYAIVPLTSGGSPRDLVPVFETFVQRSAARGVVAAIGHPVDEPADLPFARASADRSLRAALSEGASERVVSAADMQTRAMLLELRDLYVANRIRPSDPLRRLLAHDAEASSQLVPTLVAWLARHGDVVAAAQELRVHQNTLRYRMRRIREVAEADLDDETVRLGLQIELLVFAHPSQDVSRRPPTGPNPA